MSNLQVALSFGFLRNEENRKRLQDYEALKAMLKRIEQLFEISNIFTNPKAFQYIQEQKALEKVREELPPEEFDNIWKDLMESGVPEVMVMEEVTSEGNQLPHFNKDLQDLVAGFIPFNDRKDGD